MATKLTTKLLPQKAIVQIDVHTEGINNVPGIGKGVLGVKFSIIIDIMHASFFTFFLHLL